VQSSTLQCRVQLATPKQTPRAGPSQTQVARVPARHPSRVSARHPARVPARHPSRVPARHPRACPSQTPLAGPSQTPPRAIIHLSRTHSRTRQPTTPRDTHDTHGKPARAALRAIQARNEAHRTTTQRSQKEPIQNRKCGQKFGSLDAKNASEIIASRARLVLPSGRGLCGAPGAWPGDLKRHGRRSVLRAGFTAVRRCRARTICTSHVARKAHATSPGSTPTKHNHKLNMHQVIDYC